MRDPETIDCEEERCDYPEPHKHGMACGAWCPCGRGHVPPMWKYFESQFTDPRSVT